MTRAAAWALVGVLAAAAPAAAEIFKVDKFSASGDFRFRGETDWDSQDGNGAAREDRTRLRVRLRIGFRYDPSEHWTLEARIRSGAEGSQQSPHITILDFDDNDTGDASFDLDKWSLRGQRNGFHAWAGRNSLPFWKQNELLFDDDATMPGIAGGWQGKAGPGALALTAGCFATPVGMRRTSGTMFGAQAAWQPELGGIRWTFALGTYQFDADADDPDAALLQQGNGSRDYRIIGASAQGRVNVDERPLAIGFDLLHNAEDYSALDPNPVTALNADQTDGYVVQVNYGGLSAADQWLAGYTYAHIETFAVHNSYAQDDWVRWGSDTQTRASNMKGHELRFGWAFESTLHVLARLYLAEAITNVEDGKRFRVDFNWSF
ncbi:MAG TPA: putative porin [Vicinamibacterales bacterium]|nr:putative porin [Vicinamibacterales bacterium]